MCSLVSIAAMLCLLVGFQSSTALAAVGLLPLTVPLSKGKWIRYCDQRSQLTVGPGQRAVFDCRNDSLTLNGLALTVESFPSANLCATSDLSHLFRDVPRIKTLLSEQPGDRSDRDRLVAAVEQYSGELRRYMVQSEPLPLEVAIATESLLVPSLSHAQSFPESDTLLNLLAENSWRSCQELASELRGSPGWGVMVSPEGRPNSRCQYWTVLLCLSGDARRPSCAHRRHREALSRGDRLCPSLEDQSVTLAHNTRIHLTRWAVTAPAEKHRRQDHHPGLPGPRRPQPAGDANVRLKLASFASHLWAQGLTRLMLAAMLLTISSPGRAGTIYMSVLQGRSMIPPTTSLGSGLASGDHTAALENRHIDCPRPSRRRDGEEHGCQH